MATLLFEIGTEELPSWYVAQGRAGLERLVAERLTAAGVTFGGVKGFGTPRRLAVTITNVRATSPDKRIREKVLPVSVALDKDGNPSAPLAKKLAALGFPDLKISDLERAQDGKAESFFYSYTAPGSALSSGLQEVLADTVAKLPIPKVMSYQRPDGATVQFVRPVHLLLALFGEQVLPLSLLGGSVVPFAMGAGGCALGAMVGLTVHLPLYYEVVYHLTASEAGLALIPLAAISTFGAAIAGRTMAKAKHYKRVAIVGTSVAAICAVGMAMTTLPLWGLLLVMSVFALGLGTTFPISVVSLQNAVARPQVGTVTGAMNFFRAMMASFTVAAFTTILLMTLGTDISLAGEHQAAAASTVSAIPMADMIHAFRYVFGAAAVLLTTASICMITMEERPLAGPAAQPVEMAE